MATYYAIANGGFNNPAIWSLTPTGAGGAGFPTTGDIAVANSRTVTISADAMCDLVTNDDRGGAAASGGFTLRPVSLSANVIALSANCITISPSNIDVLSAVHTIVGNISAGNIGGHRAVDMGAGNLIVRGNVFGGRAGTSSAPGIFLNETGLVTVYGDVFGGGPQAQAGAGISINSANGGIGEVIVFGNVVGGAGTSTCQGILLNQRSICTVVGNVSGGRGSEGISFSSSTATVTINVTGNIFGFIQSGIAFTSNSTGICNIVGNVIALSSANAVSNGGTGALNILGNVTGGGANNAVGAINSSTGVLNITGNVTGGIGSLAYGASNTSFGRLTVQGAAIGNGWGLGSTGIAGAAPGIFGSIHGTTQVQSLCCGSRGQWPTAGHVFVVPASNSTVVMKTSAFSEQLFFTSLSANIVPGAVNVRSVVSYNFGERTGTLIMPSISSVLLNQPVDNTAGVAILQPQPIWNYSLSAALLSASIGQRLQNAATSSTITHIISSFTG